MVNFIVGYKTNNRNDEFQAKDNNLTQATKRRVPTTQDWTSKGFPYFNKVQTTIFKIFFVFMNP